MNKYKIYIDGKAVAIRGIIRERTLYTSKYYFEKYSLYNQLATIESDDFDKIDSGTDSITINERRTQE